MTSNLSYRAASRLGKAYIWLSVAIVLTVLGVYAWKLQAALTMDPNGFGCLHDSLLKQICHHPYTASIIWTFMIVAALGWPLLLAWMGVGIALLIQGRKAPS